MYNCVVYYTICDINNIYNYTIKSKPNRRWCAAGDGLAPRITVRPVATLDVDASQLAFLLVRLAVHSLDSL